MFRMVKAEVSAATEPSQPETESVPLEEKQYGKLTEYDDDESELLESRLEEQTQLIMILKKSVQDTYAKCKKLEEDNQKLISIRDTENEKLKKQSEDLATLTDRLQTMKLNYKELTGLVKDYKSQNKELLQKKVLAMEENDRLFLSAKKEADQQINAVTNKHIELKNQCIVQENQISEEKQLIELKKSQYRKSIAREKESHKSMMTTLMDDLQMKNSALEQNKEMIEREEGKLFLEMPTPDEILKLEVKNKSLRRNSGDRQDTLVLERRKTGNLHHSIKNLDNKVKLLNSTFEQKAAEVQTNEEVKDLKNQIKDAEVQFQQTKEEIANFKKEAQQKLQEERELNKKLRHIP